jgi:transposase
MEHKAYPSDVRDDVWAFVAPDLTLRTEEAPQRHPPRRERFKGLRWIVRAGAPWRLMPNDLPPWEAVSQQTRRGLHAQVCEAMGHDGRVVLRWAEGRPEQPSAAMRDRRTLPSTPESGPRAG